jgi:hypothetical protein
MSDTVLQPQTPRDPTERKMQWFLLIAILIWLLVAMIATVIAICLTRSYLSLSLFSALAPPAYLLYWIVKRLFPIDERSFKLREKEIEMKIQMDVQRPSIKRLLARVTAQEEG